MSASRRRSACDHGVTVAALEGVILRYLKDVRNNNLTELLTPLRQVKRNQAARARLLALFDPLLRPLLEACPQGNPLPVRLRDAVLAAEAVVCGSKVPEEKRTPWAKYMSDVIRIQCAHLRRRAWVRGPELACHVASSTCNATWHEPCGICTLHARPRETVQPSRRWTWHDSSKTPLDAI